ncbi:MAG TPA: hypothetical protein VGH89_07295 [Pseudonocardia sp.]|jgi:hypothetical protein
MNELNPRTLRWCAWSGPVLIVVFSAGLIPLARFFPPPSPTSGSQQIAQMYAEHATPIRIGCLVMVIGLVFLVPWGAGIAMATRRAEAGLPILGHTQVASVAMSTALIVLIPTTWALAAFRPGEIAPDVTRTVNDFGWFLLLFAWPPFSIWNVAIALAIFADKSERPLFPRWSGYLCLWDAVLLAPGGLMAFFKTGPFAWNGIMAFYVPLSVFFVWMIGMTVVLLRISRTVEERAG